MRGGSALADPPDGEPARGEPPRLQTDFRFVLPRGYVDANGIVHREGVMRLATARDELVSQRDDRVRENPNYMSVVLIGRVVTSLGSIEDVHAGRDREPVRVRFGVPAGSLSSSEPGRPHPRPRGVPTLR